MKINEDNKHSNYLLILLLLILFGVIGYKIFENYNIKHFIFEEQIVSRVKVEISEMEEYYTLNFTDENNMVKALTVRNKLRETAKHDPDYEGFYGNVHFTIYDEDGRERYDEFDDIVIEDFVWELLDINEAKMQYIDVLNVKPSDVSKVIISNPFTDKKVEIENTEELILDYSELEVVDSIMAAIKKDILNNPYYILDAENKYIITIKADKNYQVNVFDNYSNLLGIIDKICPEIEFKSDDLDMITFTYGDKIKTISKDDFGEYKEAIDDAIETFVPYTDIDSEIILEFILSEELNSKKIYGSIHKDEVTENVFDLFE